MSVVPIFHTFWLDISTLLSIDLPIGNLDAADRIEDSVVVDSYEDLVRRHVAEYMECAQKYAQITELSRRVCEWEEKIIPRLEEEERHGPFDINTYGSGVIDGLDPSHTMKFKELVQGKPTFEICRMFLASLMLVSM